MTAMINDWNNYKNDTGSDKKISTVIINLIYQSRIKRKLLLPPGVYIILSRISINSSNLNGFVIYVLNPAW